MPRKPRQPRRRQATQQRAQATVDAILTAAAQVLKRHSYAGTTTDRIAERAGVSVGSIYQYFGGKDEVLQALFVREAERLRDQIRSFEAEPGNSLSSTVERLLAIGAHNPDLDPVLYRELERVPHIEVRIRELREGVVEALCASLSPFRDQLAVADLRIAVQLIVLCAEGVARAPTDALDGGIIDAFTEMAVGYLTESENARRVP